MSSTDSAFAVAKGKYKNTVQYSTVIKTNLNNSTVQCEPSEVIECISDLIPNLDYKPWYEKQVRNLGYDRFMELVKKARSTSDTPAVLFKWMLRNNGIVK